MCNLNVILSGGSAIASIIAAGLSIYKEFQIRTQLKVTKYEDEWKKILKDLDTLADLCADYWMIAGRLKEEKGIKESNITYKCKNISTGLTLINKKYKDFMKGDMVEIINLFNAVKSEATGGDFQTKMVKIDKDRVIKIHDKVILLKEKINFEI